MLPNATKAFDPPAMIWKGLFMRKYQRGFIVAFFGVVTTSMVKIFGSHSKPENTNGFRQIYPPDFK